LDAPVYVQADEHEAALAPGYTVDEWAAIPSDRRRLVRGDEEIAQGVRLLATPGHTPGHQSVLVEGGDRRVVLGAQCAFTATELRTGDPAATNAHDPTWLPTARASLARLRALAPCTVHLSHDPAPVTLH
jgi:glyoxylase-like metal-dependent hydrolase (beta-lactamase superfamily II)